MLEVKDLSAEIGKCKALRGKERDRAVDRVLRRIDSELIPALCKKYDVGFMAHRRFVAFTEGNNVLRNDGELRAANRYHQELSEFLAFFNHGLLTHLSTFRLTTRTKEKTSVEKVAVSA